MTEQPDTTTLSGACCGLDDPYPCIECGAVDPWACPPRCGECWTVYSRKEVADALEAAGGNVQTAERRLGFFLSEEAVVAWLDAQDAELRSR